MTPRTTGRVRTKPGTKRTLEGWHANALDAQFGAEDFEVLDKTLTVVPNLRIVAFLGREARKRGLSYPVATAAELVSCLGSDKFELVGHRIDGETVGRAMSQMWFPIAHEGEFLSRIYLALLRCEAEANLARPTPTIAGR